MKRTIGYTLAFLMLGPILPLYFLKALADGLSAFLDWAVEGRGWVRPFVNASEWMQRKFKVDADTEYEEWKERMRAAGKFK